MPVVEGPGNRVELGTEAFGGGLGDERAKHLDDLGADQGWVMICGFVVTVLVVSLLAAVGLTN